MIKQIKKESDCRDCDYHLKYGIEGYYCMVQDKFKEDCMYYQKSHKPEKHNE